MKISDILNIQKGITSIIGGGGKTTLLHILANELKANSRVIITTTTHIMKSDIFHNVVIDSECELSFLSEQVEKYGCICLGEAYEDEKLSASKVSFSDLISIADYVLVEADGSKHLPLKAHLSTEPVVPRKNNKTILVVGIDAIGKRVKDCTHRYEKMCELISCDKDDIVSADMVASLIKEEHLHDAIVINKCDKIELKAKAYELSSKINERCVISSLNKGEWHVSGN